MNTIIKICIKHGQLEEKDVIKKGLTKKGTQRWGCRLCLKEYHHKNYVKNKESIMLKQKKYREENPEKFRLIKRLSARKAKLLNPEKINLQKKISDLKNDTTKKKARAKYSNRMVETLGDSYIKDLLTKNSILKNKDISDAMVQIKRFTMFIKRKVRDEK